LPYAIRLNLKAALKRTGDALTYLEDDIWRQAHVLLQSLMGWETPRYSHHDLITDDTGRKLSKSDKDETIQSLRESGMSAPDILARASSRLV